MTLSRLLSVLLLAIAAIIGLAVSALNATHIDVELAFVRINAPIGVALVVAFTFGLLAGFAWQVRWMAQLLSERGRLRRELRMAESRRRQPTAGGDSHSQQG
jgi:uncharacterized integral membrane protein